MGDILKNQIYFFPTPERRTTFFSFNDCQHSIMQQWTQRGVPLCQELFYVAWCRSEAPLVQKKTAFKKDLGYRAAQNRCSKKEDETSQLIDDFFQLSTRSTAS